MTVIFHPSFALLRRTIVVLDAIGMGLFAATGASIAIDHHAHAFAATLIGMLAAIGGGVLRDVLANEIPLLLQPADLYAVPAIVAAAVVAIGRTYSDLPSQVWVVAGLVVGAPTSGCARPRLATADGATRRRLQPASSRMTGGDIPSSPPVSR